MLLHRAVGLEDQVGPPTLLERLDERVALGKLSLSGRRSGRWPSLDRPCGVSTSSFRVSVLLENRFVKDAARLLHELLVEAEPVL